MDMMIDLETLDRNVGCVIVSCGAVVFDPDTGEEVKTYDWKPSLDEQLRNGYHVNADTLAWWMQQGNRELFTDRAGEFTIIKFLDNFRDVAIGSRIQRLWCVGTDFDVAMLRWLFNEYERVWPLSYQAARDVRTWCDALDIDRNMIPCDDLKEHNAVDDCKFAIRCVKAAKK